MSSVDEKDQFHADVNIWGRAHSGWRDPHGVQYAVFHTTEDPEEKDPVKTAQWQQSTANESSYHVLFGHDGKTVRSNDDDYSPWSVGMPGNRDGFHGSAIGKAARNRAGWLKYPKQLESMARWAADLNARYGLPLVWLTEADINAGRKGFTDHATYWRAIGKPLGMAYRWDPGPGFPYDLVLNRAAEINNPSATVEVAPVARSKEDLALDQLAGHPWQDWPGWPQLADLSLVDAVATIGAHLGIDGFRDMRDPEVHAVSAGEGEDG